MATTGQLIVQLAGKPHKTVELGASPLKIGRSPENDLVLESLGVAREHAELRWEQGVPVVTHVGGNAETRVNGTRLLSRQPQALGNGDILEIGLFTITYQAGVAAQDVEEGKVLEEEAAATPETEPMVTPEMPTEAPTADNAPAPPPALPASTQQLTVRQPEERMTARASYPLAKYSRDDAKSSFLEHLPIIFQDNGFLRRYMLLLETLWEPLEQRQDQIAMYFDPLTCPLSFLPWLAGWFGFPLNPHWPERLTRSLIKEIVELYRWRGTQYGLTRLLEIYTGAAPQIRTLPTAPFVFRIKVKLPTGREVSREEIVQLINLHKPAHLGYVLETEA